jgi:hypothetical protein
MKFELTNPKAWQAVSERSIPMGDKIKVYEKLGGAYRLGKDGGEQVFNDIKELLKHKLNEEDGVDHEVGMALNHLDDIIQNATELKSKVGTDETDLAGWIQDHISQAQNYIDQANTGFHKLDGTDDSLNEDTYPTVNVTSLVNERVDMDKLEFELKYLKKNNPGKKVEYHFIKSSEYPNGYYFTLNKKIIKNIYKNGVDGINESKWEVPKGKKEVVLSNAILDFLQDRKLITGINAQKVHKELIAFIKNKIESVNEVVSSSDMDKIKGAVEAASSFMSVGAELKKLGMKYNFSTEPLPIYMIKVGSKYFALVNKKFADKPDFVIGDIAGGMMD